jgi:hypothetical protein
MNGQYVIYMVGLDGVPVDVCGSPSLVNALWVRDRLRLAEKQQRTTRPHIAVYDSDDPERGSNLDHDDLGAVVL